MLGIRTGRVRLNWKASSTQPKLSHQSLDQPQTIYQTQPPSRNTLKCLFDSHSTPPAKVSLEQHHGYRRRVEPSPPPLHQDQYVVFCKQLESSWYTGTTVLCPWYTCWMLPHHWSHCLCTQLCYILNIKTRHWGPRSCKLSLEPYGLSWHPAPLVTRRRWSEIRSQSIVGSTCVSSYFPSLPSDTP
jgi:hypothetical protein